MLVAAGTGAVALVSPDFGPVSQRAIAVSLPGSPKLKALVVTVRLPVRASVLTTTCGPVEAAPPTTFAATAVWPFGHLTDADPGSWVPTVVVEPIVVAPATAAKLKTSATLIATSDRFLVFAITRPAPPW